MGFPMKKDILIFLVAFAILGVAFAAYLDWLLVQHPAKVCRSASESTVTACTVQTGHALGDHSSPDTYPSSQ